MSWCYKLTWYSDKWAPGVMKSSAICFLFPLSLAPLHHIALAGKPESLVHAGEKHKEKGRKSITVVCGLVSHSWLWNSPLWLLITHWLSSTTNFGACWGNSRQRWRGWKEDSKSRGRREREKHKGEGGRIKNLKRRNLNGKERLRVSDKTPPNSQIPT